jgi:hypothetical protein
LDVDVEDEEGEECFVWGGPDGLGGEGERDQRQDKQETRHIQDAFVEQDNMRRWPVPGGHAMLAY